MKILRLIVLVTATLFVTLPSWATTYYVTKTGSNSNTCTQAQTEGTAKLTIAAGMGCLAAGDTLLVGDGTYVEVVSAGSIPITPTSSARVTIKAKNRRLAIIAPGGASTRGITATKPYVTFEGFKVDCTSTASGDNTACLSNNVTGSAVGVWVLDNEIYNSQGGGMLVGGGASNWIIERNDVHDNGWATDYHNSNGLYLPSIQNSIIRRNNIYHNECNGIRFGNSASGTVDATDNIAEYNYIHDNGDGFGGVEDCGSDGSGIMLGGQRNTARYNLIINQYRTGIWFYSLSANIEIDNVAYNNTIYNVSYYGIAARTNVQNSIAKNNHIIGATLGATFDEGTGTIFSNNRTTGAITDCTVSTSNFTQKAGSACIDAGVSVGLSYNGTAPDIGAFETFTFASCEVPSSATNTIRITFNSNVNVLGSTYTTFTARRNGANNALTGTPTKIGDTLIVLPLTTSYVGGDTVDWSWASGGFTDNARIGNSINQPFLPVTNQSCTNNAAGAPTHVLTQTTFQFRGVYGPENTSDIRGAENRATYTVIRAGGTRIRFAVKDSVSNAPPVAFFLYYAKDGGPYVQLTDAFGSDGVSFCGDRYPNIGVENRAPTTNQLSTSGTFVPGAVILTANAIPTVTGLNVGFKMESEYCIAWEALASGVFTFRLYNQDGTEIAYDPGATATVTITPLQATAGH